jgi:hypothetical protein
MPYLFLQAPSSATRVLPWKLHGSAFYPASIAPVPGWLPHGLLPRNAEHRWCRDPLAGVSLICSRCSGEVLPVSHISFPVPDVVEFEQVSVSFLLQLSAAAGAEGSVSRPRPPSAPLSPGFQSKGCCLQCSLFQYRKATRSLTRGVLWC